MTRNSFSRSLRGFVETVGSVVSVAAAVDSGRRPSPRELRRLGIDPAQFGEIGRG